VLRCLEARLLFSATLVNVRGLSVLRSVGYLFSGE
jgi:hypothetical protein